MSLTMCYVFGRYVFGRRAPLGLLLKAAGSHGLGRLDWPLSTPFHACVCAPLGGVCDGLQGGTEIVEALCANSATFQQKTEFAQVS